MMPLRLLLPFLLAVCPASAQLLEIGGSGGLHRLSNSGLGSVNQSSQGDDFKLDDGFRIAFRMTTNSDGITGHEFGYAYNRTQLVQVAGGAKQGMAIHQGLYNYLLYATREGSRVRPFITGGGHFANYVPPGASATSGGGSTKFGVNYGGGIKVRVAPNWLFRIDARQYVNPKPFDLFNKSGSIRMLELSAGVSFVL
jgi:hypothetical protein